VNGEAYELFVTRLVISQRHRLPDFLVSFRVISWIDSLLPEKTIHEITRRPDEESCFPFSLLTSEVPQND